MCSEDGVSNRGACQSNLGAEIFGWRRHKPMEIWGYVNAKQKGFLFWAMAL